jgi:hypothetical protein
MTASTRSGFTRAARNAYTSTTADAIADCCKRAIDHRHADRLPAALGLPENFDGEPLGRVSAVSCGGRRSCAI